MNIQRRKKAKKENEKKKDAEREGGMQAGRLCKEMAVIPIWKQNALYNMNVLQIKAYIKDVR